MKSVYRKDNGELIAPPGPEEFCYTFTMSLILRWIITGALVVPALAFAQDTTNTNLATSTKPYRSGVERPMPLNGATKERVEAWRNTLEQKRASTSEAIKQRHEELKNAFAGQREAILQNISQRREELKLLFREKRASTTDMIRQKREGLTDEVQKHRGELLERYYTKVAELFQNRIDRLSELADKFAERIAALEDERGVDLSQASELLAHAQDLLQQASAKVDEFSDKAAEAVSGASAPAAAEAMKALRQEVWQTIQAAHEALLGAVRATKAALGQSSATTTPSQ